MSDASLGRLPEAIECLLFASSDPLTLERMAQVLEQDEVEVYRALVELRMQYAGARGMQIRSVVGGYQMVTHSDFGEYVTRLLSAPPARLSRAALETLSIIAYQQPITLPEIEGLRGVSSSGVVKTLIDRGLAREAGKKEAAGRPILYATTDDFLMYFGLKDLTHLPDLDPFEPVSTFEAEEQAPEESIEEKFDGASRNKETEAASEAA